MQSLGEPRPQQEPESLLFWRSLHYHSKNRSQKPEGSLAEWRFNLDSACRRKHEIGIDIDKGLVCFFLYVTQTLNERR